MPKTQEKSCQYITFRLTDSLLTELEEERNQLQSQSPGMRVTMADVIRININRGRKHRDDH